MHVPSVAVPVPAFASVIVSYEADLTAWLRLSTLAVGLATTVVMFLFWMSKRRKQEYEETLSRLKVDQEKKRHDGKS